MESFQKVKDILIKDFEIKEEMLVPEATLESLGLDSLDKIDLIFAIEDEFNIKIDPNDMKVNTLKEMMAGIDSLIAAKAAAGK